MLIIAACKQTKIQCDDLKLKFNFITKYEEFWYKDKIIDSILTNTLKYNFPSFVNSDEAKDFYAFKNKVNKYLGNEDKIMIEADVKTVNFALQIVKPKSKSESFCVVAKFSRYGGFNQLNKHYIDSMINLKQNYLKEFNATFKGDKISKDGINCSENYQIEQLIKVNKYLKTNTKSIFFIEKSNSLNPFYIEFYEYEFNEDFSKVFKCYNLNPVIYFYNETRNF